MYTAAGIFWGFVRLTELSYVRSLSCYLAEEYNLFSLSLSLVCVCVSHAEGYSVSLFHMERFYIILEGTALALTQDESLGHARTRHNTLRQRLLLYFHLEML